MRFATIHAFQKTPESLPDAMTVTSDGDIWRDWSAELKGVSPEGDAARL